MTAHDCSNDAGADSTGRDRDYESLGADIVVSHARDMMQTRVSALRRHLRTAFATPPAAASAAADDD